MYTFFKLVFNCITCILKNQINNKIRTNVTWKKLNETKYAK